MACIRQLRAFGMAEGSLRKLQIVPDDAIGQCRPMPDTFLILIAVVFLCAGFIKGVLGLGLPTVSMGLLAVTMSPGQAIAIVIVPAIVTNIWQTFVGPYLRDIFRRPWPLLIGTALGIWLNGGLLAGPYARYAAIALGLLLVINAVIGLSKFEFHGRAGHEKWVGGIVGVITGMISAATGVQVIPSVPYLQAIGMEKRRTGAGARRVLHGRDAGARAHADRLGLAQGGDRAAGRRGDGLLVRRDVHRPDGALADAGRGVSQLVPDLDDPARTLSRRRCARAHPRLSLPTSTLSASPASRCECRDRRTTRQAHD